MSESRPDAGELRALMAAYQAGDAASFDAVYGALAPPLRRYLTGLTRDAGRAEDLLQETFLRLHKVRHTYDRSLPLAPWAYAIARHVFLMDRRSRGRRGVEVSLTPAIPGDDEVLRGRGPEATLIGGSLTGMPHDASAAAVSSPGQRLARDEKAVAAYDVARALDDLPPDRRNAVVLHHVWGFRFDEIAARLGIREGAARLRAHRGLKTLRAFFTRTTPESPGASTRRRSRDKS